jgi:lipid-binding SYLF domain-containing protein
MKRISVFLASFVVAAVLTGCMTPSGSTVPEQKATAHKMSKDALQMIYKENPGLENKLAKAAGYGVYKNFGVQWLIPSTETGWGVVHNNKTGKDTYMKLFSIGLGLGLGFRDFRGILVFDNQQSIKDFVNSGWGAHGQANAAFKFGENGGSAAAAAEVMPGVNLYKVNVNGLVLQATFQGSKTWQNDKLNKK